MSSSSPDSRDIPRLPLASLYEQNVHFVRRTLRRFGVRADRVEDAAQDVFIVVHRRYAEFVPGTSERSWLFSIAQRVASDQRRWVRRKGQDTVLRDTAAPGNGPMDFAMRAEALHRVRAFLETLSEDMSTAFVLSAIEEMTAAEIAEATQANINTVYYRVAAVRRRLDAFIADEEVVSHCARGAVAGVAHFSNVLPQNVSL